MKLISITSIALIAIWIAGGFAIYHMFDAWDERGQFGDMFGAVNALFSSLALVGVILAVNLQKQELRLQRKELEMTREELSRSAEAQEAASKSLAQQIEKQIIAGRVAGLSALLRSMDSEIESRNWAGNPGALKKLEDKRNIYRQELVKLIDEAGQTFTER